MLNVTDADVATVAGATLTVAAGTLQYLGDSAVTLLASSVVVAARRVPPLALLATMTNGGDGVVVTFAGPTSGTLPGADPEPFSGPCDGVLENNNLGTDAVCVWTSSTTLLLRFGTFGGDALLVPAPPTLESDGSRSTSSQSACDRSGAAASQTLTFKAGAIRVVPGGVVSAARHCVLVFAPVAAVAPSVLLDAPTTIGPCDDLYIDGSRSVDTSGRPPVLAWTVASLSPAGDSAAIVGSPESYEDGAVLLAPASALGPSGAVFRVTLTITSFLLVSTSASVDVTVSAVTLPVVSVEAPATIDRASPLVLSASADFTLCGADAGSTLAAFTYAWRLVSVSRNVDITDAAFVTPAVSSVTTAADGSLAAFVAPNSPLMVTLRDLTPGAVYTVSCAATTSTARGPVTGSKTVQVAVLSSGVTVAIPAGSRDVGSLVDIPVRAVAQDLDGFGGAFDVQWTCVSIGADGSGVPCVTPAGAAVTLTAFVVSGSSGLQLNIPAGTLPLGSHRISIAVSKVGTACVTRWRSIVCLTGLLCAVRCVAGN
jgi:hypothetical protein